MDSTIDAIFRQEYDILTFMQSHFFLERVFVLKIKQLGALG